MGLILLVEDEPGAAALLRRYIENSSDGHRLAVFGKAAEALSFAAQNKVDLFILDIQLLDYRGTELARQLRDLPDYFLVKPFTEEEFQKTFHAALEMGAQMQAVPEILRIEQKQFLFEYEIRNILYIESFGKRLLIHTAQTGGSEVTDRISGYSLSKLLNMVPQDRLLQCHKSFLINPVHICKIDKANRLLYLKECETAIPIGEKYQKAVFEREKP